MLTRVLIPSLLTRTTLTLAAQSTPSFELSRETSIAKSNTIFNGVVTGDFNNDGKPAQLYIDGALVIEEKPCSIPGNSCEGTTYIDTSQSLSSGTHNMLFKLWDDKGNVYSTHQNITVN